MGVGAHVVAHHPAHHTFVPTPSTRPAPLTTHNTPSPPHHHHHKRQTQNCVYDPFELKMKKSSKPGMGDKFQLAIVGDYPTR